VPANTTTFTVTICDPSFRGTLVAATDTTDPCATLASVTHLEPLLCPLPDDITAVDTGMANERELNAVYLLGGSEPCLIEAAPESDGPAVRQALDRLGIGSGDLAHVIVTHIHMDHAGGAGALLDAFPRATLWVHERGAAHLADPTRLLASTERTYGPERMQRLYGGMRPVDAARIRSVGGGETLRFGDRSVHVLHTPGHASHHIALVDGSGATFTGEAIGSFLPWGPAYRPALPAPEVDVEQAIASIAAIRAAGATALLTSHYGATADVEGALAAAEASIVRWSEHVRRRLEDRPATTDDELAEELSVLADAEFSEQTGRPLGDERSRYDALGSIRMNAQGLGRYWRKRRDAEATVS
jgi:glyoxylase-like metal-dependent hydrolase (beta-lactamase superfamily II)